MALILVAEDERDIRELIQFTLMFAGHTVTLAANGEEAVQKAADAAPPFELVITDVRMPRLTGYEVCRQIRALPGYAATPIAFLTARGQDEEMQRGAEVGATAYLLKPFSTEDLIRRVGDLLKARH